MLDFAFTMCLVFPHKPLSLPPSNYAYPHSQVTLFGMTIVIVSVGSLLLMRQINL